MLIPSYIDYKVHRDGTKEQIKPYPDRLELTHAQKERQNGLRQTAERWLRLCEDKYPELTQVYKKNGKGKYLISKGET